MLEAEVNHEGYLSWGDGTDHSLYLESVYQLEWKVKQSSTMLGFIIVHLTRMRSNCCGPAERAILGLDHDYRTANFLLNPPLKQISFLKQFGSHRRLFDSNEINASIGTIQNFSPTDLGYELNVSHNSF